LAGNLSFHQKRNFAGKKNKKKEEENTLFPSVQKIAEEEK
jgi:hypothetical protein